MITPKEALEKLLSCFYCGVGFEWNKIKQLAYVRDAIKNAEASIPIIELEHQAAVLLINIAAVEGYLEPVCEGGLAGQIQALLTQLKALK